LAAIVHADMSANLESFKLEAEDSDGEDSDSDEVRKKQRVMDVEERDQTVHVSSIDAKAGRGLKDSRDERLAPFKGRVAPHFFEGWYALLFDRTLDTYSRMQRAVAPYYSDGAQLKLRANGKFDFEEPSANAEGSTIITQKINCLPKQKQDKMKHEYLKAHDLARRVNHLTQELTMYLSDTLAMSICLEDKEGNVLCEVKEDTLEVIQKASLFNVFMGSIWEATDASKEDEAEESESDSDSSDEEDEEDDYDGEEGEESDSSDESDDAYEEEDAEEDGEEDGEDEEDKSAGSGSESDSEE